MDEGRDPPPFTLVLVGVETGAPQRDPALRGHADHLRHHQPGAAEGLAAEMDQVEVARQAVCGDVHVHGRDDHPVAEFQRAEPERREHRGPRAGQLRSDSAAYLVPGEPVVDPLDELRVAQPQVVVGHPAAAGHDVEGELQRLLVDVLAEVLEPLEARLRCPLRGEHDRPALGVVRGQCALDVGFLGQACGKRQRVLHGELRPRADREVSGVCCVAEQYDVAVHPGLIAHGREADPAGVVRLDLIPVEDVGEQFPDEVDRLVVAVSGREVAGGAAVEAGAAPDRVVHLDDERASRRVVGVAVDLHDAVRGLGDVELECVEDEVGAEPHVLALPGLHRGAEGVSPIPSYRGVQAV